MKECTKCKQSKDDSEFYRKGERLQSFCKECFNNYCAERWISRKKEAIQSKGGKCEMCGYDKYYGALEFHHKNPTEKDVDWSKLRLRSKQKINEELNKCMLVCANCHREIHGA